LRQGDEVAVRTVGGRVVSGRVDSVSGDRIVVLGDAGRVDVPAGQVDRVRLWRNGIVAGTIIGGVSGLPFGILLGTLANNEGGSVTGWTVWPVALGAGIGAGIDALLVRPRTVFDRAARPRAVVAVGPLPKGVFAGVTVGY
jgi:hypothetical protein